MALGHIESVNLDRVRIDARRRDALGEQYGLSIAVSEVLNFQYEDARYVPSEETEAAQRAKFYDGFLFFKFINGDCYIWARKTSDELPMDIP